MTQSPNSDSCVPGRALLASCLSIAIGSALLGSPPVEGAGPAYASEAIVGPMRSATIQVANCDDGGTGSLREAVALAQNGDAIDLTALACSTISLSTGSIVIAIDDLRLIGPGVERLAIDGSETDRVLTHTGTGTLEISGLALLHGKVVQPLQSGRAKGGCISSMGTLALDRSSVSHCSAISAGISEGGCIATEYASITDSLVGGCLATVYDTSPNFAYGGGITTTGLQMSHSTVENCSALAYYEGAQGGGILLRGGPSTIENSTIRGNRSIGRPYAPAYGTFTSTQGMGGGVFTISDLRISGSTFVGNTASTGGAVISLANTYVGDPLVVENSTISGNTALSTGGGIAVLFGGLRLSNSTIAFNSAAYGGGGLQPRIVPSTPYGDSAPITLESTIIATNTAKNAADVYLTDYANSIPPTIIGSHNLIRESRVALPNDTLVADPQLLPLADNGGSTPTHGLDGSSAAIDAGSNVHDLAFDQRGANYDRLVGASVDIGSIEYDGASDILFEDGFE